MNQAPQSRPDKTEYGPNQEGYIKLVSETDILSALERQLIDVVAEWKQINEKTALMRHPPYTWSLKEVIGHINDGERIFGYRAVRFARNDTTELPGFDENEFVRNASFDLCPWTDLIEEFEALRRANILMFSHLSSKAWRNIGTANNTKISVHALAYCLVGHVRHHQAIIRQRLGAAAATIV
jgi:hypothetical protein